MFPNGRFVLSNTGFVFPKGGIQREVRLAVLCVGLGVIPRTKTTTILHAGLEDFRGHADSRAMRLAPTLD